MLRSARIAAAGLVVAMVAACGGGTAATTAPTATAAATVAPTPAPTAMTTATSTPSIAPTTAPTTAPTAAATAAPTAAPTTAPTAAPTSAPTAAAGSAGCAWIASFGYGLACLDATGWRAFTEEGGELRSDQIQDIATCADGSTWVASSLGLQVTNGTDWEDVSERLEGKSVSSVECAPDGGVWVGGFKVIGRIAEGGATWFETTELGTGEFVDQIKDLAVSADGTAWAVTPNSVAAFDGSAWRFWEEGQGFDDTIFFEAITVDAEGQPWVGYGGGVSTFDGTTWTNIEGADLSQVQSVAVDAGGRLWAGTYSKGVSVWDGSAWATFSREGGQLPSDNVKALAMDAGGRVWVGTEYGLAVFDGSAWTSYHMHSSGLVDNEVVAVVVSGAGPALPALEHKQPGTLVGTVVRDGAPLPEAFVEVCVEFIGSSFSGDSPCADQPFTKSTNTTADGTFTLEGLPVGRYTITMQTPEGKWLRVTDQFSIGVEKATIEAGKTTDLGELDLSGS